MVNKAEREELRRLLRSRFKVLRADVEARKAELEVELDDQIRASFEATDRAYDLAQYKLQLAVDEANRVANDIGRELYGPDTWGVKHDRTVVTARTLDRPGVNERQRARMRGMLEIERRVKGALLELDRQENELLTDLATSALESTESIAFFNRIPNASELVPTYRLRELTE